MSNFRPIDRQTGFLLPPSVDEWLPEKHLARFVVEVIDGLDLRVMRGSYRGSGSARRRCCWASWFMATLRGCSRAASWSGRAMTRWRSASSRRTSIPITTRSRRSGAGFSRRSRVCSSRCWRWRARWACSRWARDGTKIHANASRHSALSYEHAGKIEAQLKVEVAELLAKAEAADRADLPDGLSIPDELARREERLAKLAEARAKIEARAQERFDREQAEYRAKLAARDAKAAATGRKPRGKSPQPPVEGPLPTDQINLTDEQSRIMPVAGGGFEQCYNAQAVVAAGSLLVVAADVVQAANDKRQLSPMLDKLATLPEDLGQPETLLADTGYFSAANVETCQTAGIAPLIALGREAHHPSLSERFAEAPSAPDDPTAVEAMAHRLKTLEGRKLYAQRKHIPEPVFGIIKSVLGFRQFLLRGLDHVRGEWNLVTMAWNLKRMFVLSPAG